MYLTVNLVFFFYYSFFFCIFDSKNYMEEKDVFLVVLESEIGIDSVVSTRGRGLSVNKKSDGMNDIMNCTMMILM